MNFDRVLLYDVTRRHPATITEDHFPAWFKQFRIRFRIQKWIQDCNACTAAHNEVDARICHFIEMQFLFPGANGGFLNLSKLSLRSLPKVFKPLRKKLLRLDLSGNRLKSPKYHWSPFWNTGLYQLTALTELNLSRNQLTAIADDIGNLISLRNLNLSGNLLEALPEAIAKLKALRVLDISHNPLKSLPHLLLELNRECTIDIAGSIEAPVLKSTISRLSGNPAYRGPFFQGIEPDSNLLPLSASEIPVEWRCSIDLAAWRAEELIGQNRIFDPFDEITNSPDELDAFIERLMVFVRNEECTALDLTGTVKKLSTLPSTLFQEPFASRLKTLNLSNIKLSKLSRAFENLSALEVLNLKGCDLGLATHFNVKFPELPQLKILDLSNNCLSAIYSTKDSFNPFPFEKLSCLQELNISNNLFSELPDEIGKLSALALLNAEHNQLKELPKSFKDLSSLKILNLNCNNFNDVPSKLRFLRHLRHLLLVNDQLGSIPSWISEFQQLTELDLSYSSKYGLPPNMLFSIALLKLPASCSIKIEGRFMPQTIRHALFKIYHSDDYKGPILQGLDLPSPPEEAKESYREAYRKLKIIIDLEEWLGKHSYYDHKNGLNEARDRIIACLDDKQYTSLDLSFLLKRGDAKSFPPIFQEPFTRQIEELILSNNDLSSKSLPVEIAKLTALKKLDIKSNYLPKTLVSTIQKALSIGSEKGHMALNVILNVNQWQCQQSSYDWDLKVLSPILDFIYDEKSTLLNLDGLLKGCRSFPPIFQEPFISRLEMLVLSNNNALSYKPFELFIGYSCIFPKNEIQQLKALKTIDLRNNGKKWLKERLEVFFSETKVTPIWE